MKFKYFIDSVRKMSVAINPDRVYCVEESPIGTRILFDNDAYILVTEDYLHTVAKLSEE